MISEQESLGLKGAKNTPRSSILNSSVVQTLFCSDSQKVFRNHPSPLVLGYKLKRVYQNWAVLWLAHNLSTCKHNDMSPLTFFMQLRVPLATIIQRYTWPGQQKPTFLQPFHREAARFAAPFDFSQKSTTTIATISSTYVYPDIDDYLKKPANFLVGKLYQRNHSFDYADFRKKVGTYAPYAARIEKFRDRIRIETKLESPSTMKSSKGFLTNCGKAFVRNWILRNCGSKNELNKKLSK